MHTGWYMKSHFGNIFVTLAESGMNKLLTLAQLWPNIVQLSARFAYFGNVVPMLGQPYTTYQLKLCISSILYNVGPLLCQLWHYFTDFKIIH